MKTSAQAEQLALFSAEPPPPPPPAPRSPIENSGAALPDDTLARLKAARIRLLGMTWNDYYGYWTYQLRANWDGYGERDLSKIAQGVLRVLAVMEAK